MNMTLADVAAQRAQLWDAGFRPVPVYTVEAGQRLGHDQPGKRPAGNEWQVKARHDPPEAAVATPHLDTCNTGILCDGLRVIDLDIDNPTLAHECSSLAYQMFGEAPTRYRKNSPRQAIIYRAAEGEPAKVEIAGTLGKIEVLGRGQQLVAFGDHESGAVLQWVGEEPGTALISSIPAVTEEQIAGFLTRCATILNAKPPQAGNGQDHNANPELQADALRIADALHDIPNDGPANWEEWNRVAMATWAATAGADLGWLAFDAWSRRNAAYDPKETAARWAHFRTSPPTRIGAGTLFRMADLERGFRKFQAAQSNRAAEVATDTQPDEPPPNNDDREPATAPAAASNAAVPSAFFDPWEDPTPPEWPGGVLSARTEETLAAVSLRDGVDFAAQSIAYIAAASGAAPKNVRFAPYKDDGWAVPPILWVMLIAESGQRKTAIMETAFRALRTRHGSVWAEFMQELNQWRALPETDRRKTPKPAEPHSYIVNDATVEKLQLILAANRRGTLLLKDELAGFLGFGRYSNSGDAERAFYLETYEGGSFTVHRIGRDSTFIPMCGVAVFGCIQPDRLEEFKGLEKDGLLQRFAAIRSTNPGIEQPDVRPPNLNQLSLAIDQIARIGTDGIYTTTPEGAELIRQTRCEAREFATITDYGIGFQGFCNKLHGTHARVAMILHLLENSPERCIPTDTVRRARVLAVKYLLGHARDFYGALPGSNVKLHRDIGGWLLNTPRDQIRASDLTNNVKACRSLAAKEIGAVLDRFVTGGWLEPENDFPSNRRWTLQPGVRAAFAERQVSEREYSLTGNVAGPTCWCKFTR
jgi:hypothetical protein